MLTIFYICALRNDFYKIYTPILSLRQLIKLKTQDIKIITNVYLYSLPIIYTTTFWHEKAIKTIEKCSRKTDCLHSSFDVWCMKLTNKNSCPITRNNHISNCVLNNIIIWIQYSNKCFSYKNIFFSRLLIKNIYYF